MKEILLSKRGKNKGKYVALVDDEDFEYLNQWDWCVSKIGKTYYAARDYLSCITIKRICMHRLIMQTPDNLYVDHIDHNGLNNQKINLRNCTHQQNDFNKSSHGKSKYLGVYIQRNGFFYSQIRFQNKAIHIGCFKTEEAAAKARDEYSKKYFGEFANLNFK